MSQDPITGNEPRHDPADPLHALSRFYAAFNTRDLVLMSEAWHCAGDISMSNPVGGLMRGWQDIRGVYERIFNGPGRVYVEFYGYSLQRVGDMVLAVGRERGHLDKGGTRLKLKIRTSRVFQLVDGVFRQVHHHGSMDDPELLAAYQKLVRGE